MFPQFSFFNNITGLYTSYKFTLWNIFRVGLLNNLFLIKYCIKKNIFIGNIYYNYEFYIIIMKYFSHIFFERQTLTQSFNHIFYKLFTFNNSSRNSNNIIIRFQIKNSLAIGIWQMFSPWINNTIFTIFFKVNAFQKYVLKRIFWNYNLIISGISYFNKF